MSRNGEGVWGCSWLYCRSLGVPLRLLRARPSSSVSIWSDPCNLSWTRARRQPSLRLQEWKKRAINMQSIIPTGLHALPLLDAQVALCSLAIPLSCSGAFPLCHLSVLKGSWRPSVLCLEKAHSLFSSYSSEPLLPFAGENKNRHIVQEHGFQGKILKQLLQYQKLTWIMESLTGLHRSWRVAWAWTDAALCHVLFGGVPVRWGHLTLHRYFEALVKTGTFKDMPRRTILYLLADGQNSRATHCFSPQKACGFSAGRWSTLGKGQRNSNTSKNIPVEVS